MNPEAVAHTLSAVEGKWLTEAVAFAQCNASDTACQEDTMGEFKKSCQTVVTAVIQSSNGDKSVVSEYLGDICEQPDLHGWKKNFCSNFANGLNGVLTDDNYVNRDDLPVDTICANFLTRGFLKEAAKVEIAHAEKERQAAMEAEEEKAKKEAEEEAAEAKEREAAAKVEASKAAADVAAKMRAEAKAKLDEISNGTAPSAVAVNSSAPQSATASNSTANISQDSAVANSNAVPESPAKNTTEVGVNDTGAPVAANSTAAVNMSLAPSGILK